MSMIAFSPAIADTSVAILPQSTQIEGLVNYLKIKLPEFPIWTQINRAFLLGKVSPDWKMVQPLPINLEQDEDGTHIVSDDIFLVYGNGNTPIEAMCDYVSSLLEFFQLVKEGAETNLFDQEQLLNLQSYIQPL